MKQEELEEKAQEPTQRLDFPEVPQEDPWDSVENFESKRPELSLQFSFRLTA